MTHQTVNVNGIGGVTPLFIACEYGHAAVVAMLLAANADVSQANNKGVTPLLVACQNGHTEVVAKREEELALNPELPRAVSFGRPMAAPTAAATPPLRPSRAGGAPVSPCPSSP